MLAGVIVLLVLTLLVVVGVLTTKRSTEPPGELVAELPAFAPPLEMSFSSPSGAITVRAPEGWTSLELDDADDAFGAAHGPSSMAFFVARSLTHGVGDLDGTAKASVRLAKKQLDEAELSKPSRLEIDGLRAVQYELSGVDEGHGGQAKAYLLTYLFAKIDGEEFGVRMNASTDRADFEQTRATLEAIAASMKIDES